MAVQEIETMEFTCDVCGWRWRPQVSNRRVAAGRLPRQCAKVGCKTFNWNKGKREPATVIADGTQGMRRGE